MATQEERRRVTRERLIEAATEVLVAEGSAGFTTTEVGRRAGLSQGAVFKHFATKADLLAATVEAIFAGLVVRYEGEFAARAAVAGADDRGGDAGGAEDTGLTARLHTGLELLWDVFQDPRLLAAYDLFAAARTDEDLQRDLQPVVRAHVANLHALAQVLFPEAAAVDADRLRDAVDLAAATMQGLVVNRLAVADPEVEDRVRALLHRWVGDRLLELVGTPGATTTATAATTTTTTPGAST